MGRLLQGLTVLGWAITQLPIAWDVAKVALLIGSIGGGACLFYGILVLQATLCFWTVQSLEIMNTLTYGGCEAAQYPMTVYRPAFRKFFTYIVPLATLNYLPASALLDQTQNWHIPAFLPWASPFAGVAFLCVTLCVWRLGERRYTSTGT
jgi:ABC-2 type transport system permease protein